MIAAVASKVEKVGKIEKAAKADNKYNKAEIIRSAFQQFGMDTSTAKISDYYKKVTGEEVDSRYIHLTKSNMKKSMAEGSPAKSKVSRKTVSRANNSDIAASIIKLRELIEAFGGKQELLAVLDVI
jgi:hypothetical protein